MHKIISAEGKEHLNSALKRGRGAILFLPIPVIYFIITITYHKISLVVATALDDDLFQLYLIFHRMGCQGLDYDTTNKREMLHPSDKAGATVFLNSILGRFIKFIKPSQWFYWFNIHTRYDFDSEENGNSLVS